MIKTLICIISILSINKIAICQTGIDTTQLIFIQTESFIAKGSNSKLLIDYDNSSTITNDSYYSSKSPFDNIDVISVSHIHSDHYDRDLSGNYLYNNSKCRIILPSQVYESFKTFNNFEKIKDRVISIELPDYSCGDVKIETREFKYVMVPHAAGLSSLQNMICIFNSGNIKFLHSGDYWGDNIDSIKCSIVDENIDVAMIHFNFLLKPNIEEGLERVKKYIKPKFIILMHIPQNSEQMKDALKAKEELKDKYPNVFVFTGENKKVTIIKIGDLIKIQ